MRREPGKRSLPIDIQVVVIFHDAIFINFIENYGLRADFRCEIV